MDAEKKTWYLGIDDTDGPSGGCTTYTMTRIIDALHKQGAEFLGLPRLIRLNPNVPFKTRGNGALGLTFRSSKAREDLESLIKEIVLEDVRGRTSEDEAMPAALLADHRLDNQLYHRALTSMIDYHDYVDAIRPLSVFLGMTRGIIGAYNAMYPDLSYDFTYELLLYRRKENLGKERVVFPEQVRELAEKYKRSTFSSFDFEQGRELIAPSGPDPVFAGIRGEELGALKSFATELQTGEELEGYTVFVTNQGTAVNHRVQVREQRRYNVVSSQVEICSVPEVMQGGHLRLDVRWDGRTVRAMVFEPTKGLVEKAQKLLPGDEIYIHGAYAHNKHGDYVSLEQFRVISLASRDVHRSPRCTCGERMESAGFLKGYKCRGCGNRTMRSEVTKGRAELFPGELVYASKSAQRHLTRPWEREYRRNRDLREEPVKYESFRSVWCNG